MKRWVSYKAVNFGTIWTTFSTSRPLMPGIKKWRLQKQVDKTSYTEWRQITTVGTRTQESMKDVPDTKKKRRPDTPTKLTNVQMKSASAYNGLLRNGHIQPAEILAFTTPCINRQVKSLYASEWWQITVNRSRCGYGAVIVSTFKSYQRFGPNVS